MTASRPPDSIRTRTLDEIVAERNKLSIPCTNNYISPTNNASSSPLNNKHVECISEAVVDMTHYGHGNTTFTRCFLSRQNIGKIKLMLNMYISHKLHGRKHHPVAYGKDLIRAMVEIYISQASFISKIYELHMALRALNKLTLEKMGPMVLKNLESHRRYIRELDKPRYIVDRVQHDNGRDFKTLDMSSTLGFTV